MKRTLIVLSSVFVSPELLVIVLGFDFCCFRPGWFASLSQRIGQEAELLKYLGLIPAGLLVFDLRTVKNILLPDADGKTILQGWERYWSLRCGCVVGFLYAFLFLVGGIAALLFDWHHPEAYQSAFLITSIAGALVVSGSLYYANICIEEHFRQYAAKI